MARVELYLVEGTTGKAIERRIFIKTPFALKEKCASLPGARWHKPAKMWTVPATASSAAAIAAKFKDEDEIVMQDGVQAIFEAATRATNAQQLKHATDLAPTPTTTEAWLHQRRAFHFARELDAAMLAMDMGTGKSLVAIALLKEWDAKLVLVLCPKSVVGVWPKQFREHCLEPDEWMVIAPHDKQTVNSKAGVIAKAFITGIKVERNVCVVVNYEAAWREGMAELLRGTKWDAIILDESHRVKSAGGKQSKYVTSLRDRARKRLALTGTPMPHSPMDIYAQYRFLDPGVFGTSKNRFQNRYAVTETAERRDGRTYEQVVDWQNQDEFNDKFASIAFVVSKDEALPDLPEKIFLERTFELSPKGVNAYVRMARDFVLQVDEGVVVAANAMTKMLRLRQIAAGHSKTDEGETVIIDEERAKALGDFLQDLPTGEPVVVFASFHADLDNIERVATAMGLRYGELSGRRRDGLTEDATMAPDIDVLGCQLKSGGVGIDLTRACYAVYYTVGYELGDYDQSQDRLHRPGQTRAVRYVHMVAQNVPIDRVVMEALQKRKNVVQAILAAAKERRLVV